MSPERPRRYLCPRCRAEQAQHDCAVGQQGLDFELHATLTFPIPLYSYGLAPESGLAAHLTERFESDPTALKACLKDAVEIGDYEITIESRYVDPT